MKLNLIHYPLNSLGPDERIGVWFQGCSIHCIGCMSKHTWNPNEGFEFNVDEVMSSISYHDSKFITISGGEPFEQPEELYKLLKALKNSDYEILVYSGFSFEYLKNNYLYILDLIDVLIDEPFDESQKDNLTSKGSDNQQIIILSNHQPLIQRYSQWAQKTQENLQIIQTDNQMYIIGISQHNIKEIINDTI